MMIRKRSMRLDLIALKQVHGVLVVKGITSDLQSLRKLLLSYIISFHGNMDYARKLFEGIPLPDLFIWNSMIRGYAHSSNSMDAISIYRRMKGRGLSPNCFTFSYLLKACTKLSSPCMGSQFHGMITKLGFLSDAFVRNALISMHANCGDLAIASLLCGDADEPDVVTSSALIAGYLARGALGIARRLFDELLYKDLVCWNIMMGGYAKQGEMEKARELFDRAPHRDVVSWNTMIAGYALKGSEKQALEMFEQMLKTDEKPDEATVVSLLSSCANSGSLEIGQRIHSWLSETRQSRRITLIGNALINMYAKCGSLENAMVVFREMKERDVWTWNSIFGALALHGQAKDSVQLFDEMLTEGVTPNEVSFLCVLGACSHGGMLDDGRRYFSLMKEEYNIKPTVKHYGCLVDMLGRAGLLKEAFEVVNSMRIKPSAIIWRTLLGACRIHGDIELGELAREKIRKMRGDASGDYVLMSNIYASNGEWIGVEKVRKLMDERGVRKVAGCTQVDADNK
ncbi:pentatricopeptide repeat-containing protein At5g15300-like [Typha angustifolia]|uniref:pentatricopeptide repeat-containing protein At5g15300-like n=1 Tax=Typha angustifolia TaxID=59011 RepID=UPI003C2D5F0D